MSLNSEEYKSVFASTTMWGLVLMVVGKFTGVALPVELAGEVAGLVETGFEVIGGIMIAVGRVKATKKLSL